MKTFTLLVLLCGCAFSVAAQTAGSYSVDNFDFANGIRIEKSAPPPRLAKRTKRNGKSGKSHASVEAPADAPSFTRLTSMTPTTLTSGSQSLDGFSTGDATVDNLIVDSGSRNGVDPVLLYAIMHQESTFKSRAVSPKGARGLMQLMPGTAARYGVRNIFDPRQNIEGGARYVRFLLDTFDGDVKLALAGYNAGENAVMRFGNRIPPYSETQEYVRRISKRYSLMRDPLTAQSAPRLRRDQVASLRDRNSTPLNTYERSVYAVRLPDGRLQLVSQ